MGINSQDELEEHKPSTRESPISHKLLFNKLKGLEADLCQDVLFPKSPDSDFSKLRPFELIPHSNKDLLWFKLDDSNSSSDRNSTNNDTPLNKTKTDQRPHTTTKANRRLIRLQKKTTKPNNSKNHPNLHQTPRILTRRAKRQLQSVKIGREKKSLQADKEKTQSQKLSLIKNKKKGNYGVSVSRKSSDYSEFFALFKENKPASTKKLMPRTRKLFVESPKNETNAPPINKKETKLAETNEFSQIKAERLEFEDLSKNKRLFEKSPKDKWVPKIAGFLRTPEEAGMGSKSQTKIGLFAKDSLRNEPPNPSNQIAKKFRSTKKKEDRLKNKENIPFFSKRRKIEIPALAKAKRLREAEEKRNKRKQEAKGGKTRLRKRAVLPSHERNGGGNLIGKPLRVVTKFAKGASKEASDRKQTKWLKTSKLKKDNQVEIPCDKPEMDRSARYLTIKEEGARKDTLRFTPNASFSGDELWKDGNTPSWAKSAALKEVLAKQRKENAFPPIECPVINLTAIFDTVGDDPF